MALTAARVCDCQAVKVQTPSGLLQCPHCDTGACKSRCPSCTRYAMSVAHRISRSR